MEDDSDPEIKTKKGKKKKSEKKKQAQVSPFFTNQTSVNQLLR
jgi:hypothetical protein